MTDTHHIRAVTTTIRRWVDAFAWRLLPGVCILCNRHSGVRLDLCADCSVALLRLAHACRMCALPLANPAQECCAACVVAPPLCARAIAALAYAGPVIRMIHRLKFAGSRVDARIVGTLLGDCVADAYRGDALPQVLLPVPLSRARLLWRGHNQAALLARWAGRRLALPVRHDGCARVRDTRPQTGLSRDAQLRNLSGAFAARRAFTDLRIAIVDDVLSFGSSQAGWSNVLTTGTTVAALTRTLLEAGAVEVHVWAAARTLAPHDPVGAPPPR